MLNLCNIGEGGLTHFLLFHQLGQHDDHPTSPVIDHLPEVTTGALHWSLGYDVASLLLVALQRTQPELYVMHSNNRIPQHRMKPCTIMEGGRGRERKERGGGGQRGRGGRDKEEEGEREK